MKAGSSRPYRELTGAAPGSAANRPTHKEDPVSARTRIRRTAVLALAGGTLAIGVPAALAAGGGSDAGGSDSGAPATRFVQDEQQQQQEQEDQQDRQNRPDHDCPERDGGNSGSGSSDSGADASTPAV